MRVAFRNAARVGSAGDPLFEIGDLRVDLAARRVLLGGAEVHLTRTQFNLLAALVKHAGKVMTHRELLRDVWSGPRRSPLTCGSTWASSGTSWRPIPPARGTW
jgi:two-component system KDP operon response regulator KdpE